MSKPIKDQEQYLDYRGLCNFLHISYATARKWKSMGLLTYTKFRGRILFPKSAILRELKKNTIRSTPSMIEHLEETGKIY